MKDFIQRMVQGVNDMGTKAMTIVDTTGLRAQVTELKVKIECDYKAIGKQVHEAISAGTEAGFLPDISEKVNSIKEKEAKIEELNTKILALNNEKKCAQCGEIIGIKSKFCHECGTENPIPEDEKEEEPKLKRCTECDNVLADSVKFCSNCGTAVNEE